MLDVREDVLDRLQQRLGVARGLGFALGQGLGLGLGLAMRLRVRVRVRNRTGVGLAFVFAAYRARRQPRRRQPRRREHAVGRRAARARARVVGRRLGVLRDEGVRKLPLPCEQAALGPPHQQPPAALARPRPRTRRLGPAGGPACAWVRAGVGVRVRVRV